MRRSDMSHSRLVVSVLEVRMIDSLGFGEAK